MSQNYLLDHKLGKELNKIFKTDLLSKRKITTAIILSILLISSNQHFNLKISLSNNIIATEGKQNRGKLHN
jgi:hypothetical protein